MLFSRRDTDLRPKKAQLELGIQRQFEHDRNFHKGGRSFYFFDFDDNIAVLNTNTFIFHKETGHELALSSREFAEHGGSIGKYGEYRDFDISFDDEAGTFRAFRDRDLNWLERFVGQRQFFITDLMAALGQPDFQWKGPSWDCFYHAVFNQRPMSVITARGHEPDTIKKGIQKMILKGHLTVEPNYLSIFPVNNPKTRERLSNGQQKSVAELKQAAIRASVEEAIKVYGDSPFHRFGMSDDDPTNIQLIIEEMARLKRDYSEMSFFVIDTHGGEFVKREVFEGHTEDQFISKTDQLSLV